MDDIVKLAIAKWPNVPHCYGWLALDARGNWRMRDERAQGLGSAGEAIRNPALLAFINRNYTHDERGRWYFQNGPQRVYVNLEVTPYIARTDPASEFALHTGEALTGIDCAWLTDGGRLLLAWEDKVAAIDDRDLGQCLDRLLLDAHPPEDDELLAWIADPQRGQLALRFQNETIPVCFSASAEIAEKFGFDPAPQAPQE